jgi:hypothetical protein
MIQRTLLPVLFTGICFLGSFDSIHAQYETFCESFDLLSTIAGKGDVDDKGDNGWLNEYEGGSATAAELSRPHMAMADSAGNIYIADKDAHAIRKIAPDGIITTVAGTNTAGDGGDGVATELALNAPNGLWVNKAGDIYILDLGNDKIRMVDLQGTMATIIHDENTIAVGRGLWVSATEDTIWYANGSNIKRWTEDGGITVFADGFSGLGNIIQDVNGDIIATDRVGNTVYRIDVNGNKTAIAGNGSESGGGDGSPALETALYGVRGVWCLPDNSLFLATHEGSRVWYMDTEGMMHIFLDGREGDEYHSGDGQNYRTPGAKVSEVRAVTVDYQGNVLVTENDRGFIRKISRVNSRVVKPEQHMQRQFFQVRSHLPSGGLYIQVPPYFSGKVTVDISDIQGRRLHQTASVPFFRKSTCIVPEINRSAAGCSIVRMRTSDTFSGWKLITVR